MRRYLPDLPWVSAFPELNVRTYVERDGKPGVWFLSLDATNPLAVWAARRFFHLPYFRATMSLRHEADGISYRSQRAHASFEADYAPISDVYRAVPWFARALADRAVLPLRAGPKRRTVEERRSPRTLAPAKGRGADPHQHDGGVSRPRPPGTAGAAALRPPRRRGGVVERTRGLLGLSARQDRPRKGRRRAALHRP